MRLFIVHILILALLPMNCRTYFLARTEYHRHGSTDGTKPTQDASRKQTPRAPRVFFLFMAVDKIFNWGVWETFFKDAPADRFQAFIHCKNDACKRFAEKTKLLQLVPTVQTSYCADLVSPMNQLLATASLSEPTYASPGDKFAFVSDSTLPAKPFWYIYSTLTQRDGSGFCVFPSKDWADVPFTLEKNGKSVRGHEVAVKSHQWMVLSRTHAESSARLWQEHVMYDIMSTFHLNTNSGKAWQAPGNRSFGDNRNFGCLDEYWHMYVLFGPWSITDTKTPSEYHLKDFFHSPLRVNPEAGWQGVCDTFALWPEYAAAAFETPGGEEAVSPWVKLYSSLDQASMPHLSSSRPAWWDSISGTGIKAIRDSDFLFVRKFVEKPQLVYGGDFNKEYSRMVLSSSKTLSA